jgi:acetyl-CoA synthetase
MAEREFELATLLERWRAVADDLQWSSDYNELFRSDPPYDDWFVGGRLNLSTNCTDRHLAGRASQVAVHWEGEPGDRRQLTYAELHREVEQLTAALRGVGVEVGDRVALHLGWLPETVIAMLACARLGAEYTVIPVALPVEALALRLDDFRPRVLFTQDGGWRRGAILPLKARADEALEATSGVQHTVVVRRTGVKVDWFAGDLWYDELLTSRASDATGPTAVPSAHPFAAVYLANRRGRPVAVRHGTANLAVSALAIHQNGLASGDVFWCAGDISWLGAQAHGVFGPLLAGATALMYEGTLDVPDPSRTWQMVERYHVSSLITSPSIARALRGWSPAAPVRSTGSLRRMTTIGERLDSELRTWLGKVLGQHVTIADGWGQVELGGIVTLDRPVDADRLPDPGFAILDEAGSGVENGDAGEWVMLGPWAGGMRSVEVHGEDPTAAHWTRHPGHYATGDLARRNDFGGVDFLGRLDEVVSVSGQLVSLNEVRDVLLDHPFVAQAEVFERTDPRLGRSVAAAVVLNAGAPSDSSSLHEMQDWVRELLGGLSRPRALLVVDRFGSELEGAALRRALAVLSAAVDSEPLHVTWEQVLASSGHDGTARSV